MLLSDDDEDPVEQGARRDVEGGNTSLNTALNAILTQPTVHRTDVSEAHDGCGGSERSSLAADVRSGELDKEGDKSDKEGSKSDKEAGKSDKEGDKSEKESGKSENEGGKSEKEADKSEGESYNKSEGESYNSGGEEERDEPPAVGARNSWSMEGDVLAADLEELMDDLTRVGEAMQRLHGAQANLAVTVARSTALAPPPNKPESKASHRTASPILAEEDFPKLG